MIEPAAPLRVIEESPAYWRVVFDSPPFNILGAGMFAALQDLLARMDATPSLRVVVFESANPDFYLAHFDLADPAGSLGLIKTAGPSGLPILMDTFVRLTRSPIVSIAKIRGRLRGASSEFVLACDMRFASRENTALAQVEVGAAAVARSKSSSGRTTSTARQPNDTDTSTGRFRTASWMASSICSRVASPPSSAARSPRRRIWSTKSRCLRPTACSTPSTLLRPR